MSMSTWARSHPISRISRRARRATIARLRAGAPTGRGMLPLPRKALTRARRLHRGRHSVRRSISTP